MSSGVPVSFHQPVTVSYSIVFPSSINNCNASVISNSPLHEGFNFLMISKIFGVRKYTPITARFEVGFFGFSTIFFIV